MREHHQAAPLVVVRSEAETGRVGLRLIGELDLNTVELLGAASSLAPARMLSRAVIDLSELRFLDLARPESAAASRPERRRGAPPPA